LGKEFIDSDHEIEARTGVNIPLIFELEGERGFREREAAVIDELTARENVVLATGGGAVLYEENRQHLKERGTVIYLQASIEQLLERTRKDKNRPLLQTADPEARLQALLTEREPLYLELADLVMRTGQGSVRSVVESILQKLP
ncbi:MAG: shikimate kinase, partial [Thiohalophilus sp.]|uniref:shikimate kinase n=1 Tax=Thiohalophilus sp. TaxID=3028392 RepID=UPI0028703B33